MIDNTDTVQRLYLASESLLHIAYTLPEACGGLAFLLQVISEEVHNSAALMDDAQPPDLAAEQNAQ